MHVSVTFKHMDSSDALKAYAEEKSEKIAKYLVEPIEVHWFLSVEKKIRHIAEVTVIAKHCTVKATEKTDDMYAAIDTALDKVERQVKKHKEKVKDHHKSESPKYAEGGEEEEEA
ncbi:MAG: ribosome-associated translation inhibitor RaiA [Deltaproteobacteria bacterium]|nr:ribosome-associated translation inhibitor RaiA [Deltaproteobacteria bacterium]